MSNSLRIILLVSAVLLFAFVYRKLRKSQLQLMTAFFWIMFSTAVLILGVFPEVGLFFAGLLGIESAANCVFLLIISLLILCTFLLTIRVSTLEHKVTNLTQEIAIRKNMEEKKD